MRYRGHRDIYGYDVAYINKLRNLDAGLGFGLCEFGMRLKKLVSFRVYMIIHQGFLGDIVAPYGVYGDGFWFRV